jgi:hypothetical protein
MIVFIITLVTSSLYHLNTYKAIVDLHNLQFTVAHVLGLSVVTSRLLATDLNTETRTSSHYEVFFLFRLQSLWNLGTKNSSGLTPPAYDWLIPDPWNNFLTAFTSLISTLHRPHGKQSLYCCWRHHLRGSVFTEPLLINGMHNPVVAPLLGATT